MIKAIGASMLLYTTFSAGCASEANENNNHGEDEETVGEVATNSGEMPEGTIVLISTDYGDIKVLLYDDTPKHRDNFIKLASEGYFNELLFHRVIKDFMIQGGDPDSRNAQPGVQLGNGGPGYTIPAEFNPAHYHKKGVLSAARQPDQVNPNKESSGSQFYIVQGQVYDSLMLNQMASQLSGQMIQTAITAKIQSDAVLLQEVQQLQQDNDQVALSEMVATLTILVKAEMMGKPITREAIANLEQSELDEINAYNPFSFSDEQIEAYTTIGGTPFLDMNYTVFGEVIEGLEIIDQIAVVETDQFDRPKIDVEMTITVLE